MTRRNTLSSILIIVAFGALTGLVLVRMHMVDLLVADYIACTGCFRLAVLQADGLLFSLVAAVLLAGGLLRPEGLGRIVHLLIGVLLLVYVCDLSIMHLFGLRLFLSDAALFVAEPAAVWDQFSGRFGWHAYAVLMGLLVLFVLLIQLPTVRSRPQRLFLLAILLFSVVASQSANQQAFVNAWAVANVFSANLDTSERRPYSKAEKTRVLALEQKVRAVRGPVDEMTGLVADPGNANTNVTVVIVESWSSWHSELFGGFENWTPRLDAAARSGLRFGNFHSIGFATANGLVGILAGQQLWSPFLNWFETPPFHSNWGLQRSLPKIFSQQGHHTAFLTSGPIGLTDKANWIENLGFDVAEGNHHPHYNNLPRYALGAASDEALYERARNWQLAENRPYLLVLETVSSHQPYTDPVSGQNSLELAIKYSDRAFGEYLKNLRADGYFEEGILLVVSDHRSMTPMSPRETETMGQGAHSRIPAFIIGKGFGPDQLDDRAYSQSDLIPSLELWLNGSAQLEPLQAIMFGQELTNHPLSSDLNCAFHVRGDIRGWVDVICNRGLGQVKLDGDQTRFLTSSGLDNNTQAQIIDRMAYLRLQGMQRHEQWQAHSLENAASSLK